MSTDRIVRIRIGASVDSSVAIVFQQLEAVARRARTTIAGEMKAAGASIADGIRTGGNRATLEAQRAGRKIGDNLTLDLKMAERQTLVQTKRIARHYEQMTNDAIQHLNQLSAAQAKLSAGASRVRVGYGLGGVGGGGGGGGGALGTLGGLGRMVLGQGGAAGVAFGAARSMARAVGVETDIEAHLQRQIQLKTQLTDISNNAYRAGAAGMAGVRVSEEELEKEVFKVAKYAAYTTEAVGSGLKKFGAITGDLQLGRDLLKDMAMLSRATGAEIDQTVSAAADLASRMGDSPDKAERILKIMRGIAAQGQLGSVEMEHMVRIMGKIAAVAPFIASREGGTKTEQYDRNVAMGGAFVQLARQHGTATNAAEAATSVMNLMNTFGTPARRAAFEKITGKKVEDSQGNIRDWRDLFKDALRATGGDTLKWKAMFQDIRVQKTTEGVRSIYKQAGGGEAGIAAFEEEIKKLMDAQIDATQLTKSFALALDTPQARIQTLNLMFQELSDTLLVNLLPAVLAAAPAIAALAVAAGRFANWVTGTVPGSDDREKKVVQAKLLREKMEGQRAKGEKVEKDDVEALRKLDTDLHEQVHELTPKIREADAEKKEYTSPFGFVNAQKDEVVKDFKGGHSVRGLARTGFIASGGADLAQTVLYGMNAAGLLDPQKTAPMALRGQQENAVAEAQRDTTFLRNIDANIATMVKQKPVPPPETKENGRSSAVQTRGPAPIRAPQASAQGLEDS